MGDRGNIFFVDRLEAEGLEGIYMYTHWSGSMLPLIVRDALERGRERWGDPQYLARIVFCELIKDAILEETGYGLGTRLVDNEHIVIRIDDLSSRVSFHEPGKERLPDDPGLVSWSYEEYLATRTAEAERAFLGEPAIEPDTPLPKAIAAPKAGGKAKADRKAKADGKAKATNGKAKATNGKAKADGKAKAKARGNGHGSGSRARGNGHGAAASRPRAPRRRAGAK